MSSALEAKETTPTPDRITKTIVDKLNHPSGSSDFDFYDGVNQVLADVGNVSSGQRWNTDVLCCRGVERPNGRRPGHSCRHSKVLSTLRRLLRGDMETVNGRSPLMGSFENNPVFKFPLFRERAMADMW